MLKFLWSGAHTAATMTGLPTSDIGLPASILWWNAPLVERAAGAFPTREARRGARARRRQVQKIQGSLKCGKGHGLSRIFSYFNL